MTQVVGKVPVLRTALRWYANQFLEGSVVRIKQGHARGLFWKRYHRYVNGYWIGHYEFPIQDALIKTLKAGDTFFDVGANAGFFTLIASSIVGQTGKCVAFDPSPENAESISEQLALNSLKGTVVKEAVGHREGEANFYFEFGGSPIGHLGNAENGELATRVKVTTLDVAATRFGAPNVVKMDIEGAEVEALEGAIQLLTKVRPILLIELHGAKCAREVKARLLDARYQFFHVSGGLVDPTAELPEHVLAMPVQ